MRLERQRQSDQVEDRRGMSRSMGLKMGGFGGLIIVVIAILFGINPGRLQRQLAGPQAGVAPQKQDPALKAEEDEAAVFVSKILASTEDVWGKLFQEMGKPYRKPKLVIFSGVVESACGRAEASMGPFYCPLDETVYIDLSFYRDLAERHNAPGDFAQAYVIAHEVGHHVQHLLGISDQVQRLQQRAPKVQANQLSVRLELQADFLAGVWAHHAEQDYGILERGDIEEGLNAAAAIGDDRLQKQATGWVRPDSFTHGSSEQRVEWFAKGLKSGDMEDGDTFATEQL
jgi:predicted metalloprotease